MSLFVTLSRIGLFPVRLTILGLASLRGIDSNVS